MVILKTANLARMLLPTTNWDKQAKRIPIAYIENINDTVMITEGKVNIIEGKSWLLKGQGKVNIMKGGLYDLVKMWQLTDLGPK